MNARTPICGRSSASFLLTIGMKNHRVAISRKRGPEKPGELTVRNDPQSALAGNNGQVHEYITRTTFARKMQIKIACRPRGQGQTKTTLGRVYPARVLWVGTLCYYNVVVTLNDLDLTRKERRHDTTSHPVEFVRQTRLACTRNASPWLIVNAS